MTFYQLVQLFVISCWKLFEHHIIKKNITPARLMNTVCQVFRGWWQFQTALNWSYFRWSSDSRCWSMSYSCLWSRCWWLVEPPQIFSDSTPVKLKNMRRRKVDVVPWESNFLKLLNSREHWRKLIQDVIINQQNLIWKSFKL